MNSIFYLQQFKELHKSVGKEYNLTDFQLRLKYNAPYEENLVTFELFQVDCNA